MASNSQTPDPRGLPDFLTQAALLQLPWFGLWAGSNLFFYRSRILNQDSRNHCVALVYSLWALIFATSTFCCDKRPLAGPNSACENDFLVFSLSYAAFDLAVCAIHGHLTARSLASYACAALGLGAVLRAGFGAPILLLGALIVESSSALLHIRKVLGNMKKRHTLLYELTLLGYLVTFVVGRGIFGSLFVLYLLTHMNLAPRALLVAGALILAESLSHFSGLLQIFRSCVDHRDERTAKGVSLWLWRVNPELKTLDYYKAQKQRLRESRTKTA